MSNEEKIEVAEKRILELETLIQHWRLSEMPSRKGTGELFEVMLNTRTAA